MRLSKFFEVVAITIVSGVIVTIVYFELLPKNELGSTVLQVGVLFVGTCAIVRLLIWLFVRRWI